MDRKLGMFLNTKHIGSKRRNKEGERMGLEYIQLYAMNPTFNLVNISKVQWNTLKENLAFNEIQVPSLAISFGENGIIGTEAECAIESFKYITDKGLRLGANIVTAHIGKIPDDENSEYYDKMIRVCNEIGELAFRFGGFFAIETGSRKSDSVKAVFRKYKFKRISG